MANAARAPLSRSTRRADEKRFRSVRNAAGGRAVRKGGRWPPASVASSAGPPGGAREAGPGGGREGARTGAVAPPGGAGRRGAAAARRGGIFVTAAVLH